VALSRPAPAKINLGLHVLRRRADGYHDLDTVFLRIGWADTVAVATAPDRSLTCTDPSLPTDASNLCLKAALRLAAHTGVTQGAAIHLEKYIPHGAGLGGGSSDAAATLLLLNDLWHTGLSPSDLHVLAAGLGSDVPFFLGPAAARGTGRGDVLAPLLDATGRVYGCPFHFVVAKPSVSVSTTDAYRWIVPREDGRPDLSEVVASNDLVRWRHELVNDFEEPAFGRFPLLRTLRDGLYADGAGYAAMTGSGSAVFGVFHAPETARRAARRLSVSERQVWVGPAEGV
jgi:4-diphosphocytidyl-2-C-methyl-D-erythritol kinase